jgi:hypothetical protein
MESIAPRLADLDEFEFMGRGYWMAAQLQVKF